jgi:Ca2+:H+ antiporter
VFQLFSHKALYDDQSGDVKKSIQYAPHRSLKQVMGDRAEKKAKKNGTWVEPSAPAEAVDTHTDVEANSTGGEEESEPKTSVAMTIGLLCVVTVVCGLLSVLRYNELRFRALQLVAITAEWLVDSIDGLTDTGGISKEFVGIILLPIVGNAAGWFQFFVFKLTSLKMSLQNTLLLSRFPSRTSSPFL